MEVIANQILADIRRQRKAQKENNDIKTISEKPEIEKAPEVTGIWLKRTLRRILKLFLLNSALEAVLKPWKETEEKPALAPIAGAKPPPLKRAQTFILPETIKDDQIYPDLGPIGHKTSPGET